MKKLLLSSLAAVLTLAASASTSQAVFTFTLRETAGGVTVTGLGTLDLTGLTTSGSLNGAATIRPASGLLLSGTGTTGPLYAGISGPAAFGTGTTTINPTTVTGDRVGVFLAVQRIAVPTGYVSNNPLSDSMTFTGETFASLGFTPGTYTYALNSGDSLVITGVASAVPEPSTWALLGVGAGLLGFVTLRGRRAVRA